MCNLFGQGALCDPSGDFHAHCNLFNPPENLGLPTLGEGWGYAGRRAKPAWKISAPPPLAQDPTSRIR